MKKVRSRWNRIIRYAVPVAVAGIAVGGLQVLPAEASPTSAKPVVTTAHAAEIAACPWMNTKESASKRAKQLLAASTLDQKLRWLDQQAADSPTVTSFGRGTSAVTYPLQVACTPTVVAADGPDYVRGTKGKTTVYPTQISLGASWDPALAYSKGASMADEAFRDGINDILGPAVSSARTPLDGRTPEYLGEDSLLSGDLAAAQINGLQNGNPTEPDLAVLKHFIANEQELDRQTSSSNVDGRSMREVYNLPFQIALSKSDPGGVMCSYNQVNGVYSCENPDINGLLDGADNYNGFVVSDFGAVHSTAPSLNAGMDQELNAPKYLTPANINAAIDSGTVTVAEVDEAAYRVVFSEIKDGLFDHLLPTTPSAAPSTDANKAVAEKQAEEGSVLLQNTDSVLPLTKNDSSIAIIGATASATATNGISASSVCSETGADATPADCPSPAAPLDSITTRAAQVGATVTYNNGMDTAAAAAAAALAKVAVVFAYTIEGEGADKTTLSLDGNGDALIEAVAAANPNTIVVLETGSAVTMPWLSQVKGVVEAWYPGQEQGPALAKLLYGDVNFTGRLPLTFPASLADTPTAGSTAQYPGLLSNGSTTRVAGDTSIRQVTYSEGLAVGYKWYESKDITPLFPFGYGLSYTTFSYTKLQLSKAVENNTKKSISVSFTVKNTGNTKGTATPEVYLTLPSSTGEPGQRLVGFSQVTLRAGESQKVSVTIDPTASNEPLSYWNTTTHAWTIASGSYGVAVGGSSNAGLSASFTVS